MISGFCVNVCDKYTLIDEVTDQCICYCKICNKPVTEINWDECPLKLATPKTEYEEIQYIMTQATFMNGDYVFEHKVYNDELKSDNTIVSEIYDKISAQRDDCKLTVEERTKLSKIYEKYMLLENPIYEKYYNDWVEEEYTVNEQTTPESSSNYKSSSSSSSYSSPYSSSSSYSSSQSKQSSQSQQQCVPKCPTCGSTNVAPISTGKKMLGLLTLGLASKGIGKSYCCKNCGYYW